MMSQTSGKGGFTPRSGMPAFGTFGAHQGSASLLLDRSNPGLRRSTPDSEALASSDDEVDLAKMSAANVSKAKTTRRKSWLNDVSLVGSNRKTSVTGAYSPNPSNPGTPAIEQSIWTPGPASSTGTWNNPSSSSAWSGIWGQDNRKEPPSRLHEVTSAQNDHSIPFHIPLQPTPKTYRSQSYSVGQIDLGLNTSNTLTVGSGDFARSRLAGQFPQLQRRSSRTSGATGSDGGGLGRVKEVDDDAEADQEGVDAGERHSSQARMIERLEKENAQLRHAAQKRELNISGTSPIPTGSEAALRNTRTRSSLLEGIGQAAEGFDGVDAGPYPGHGSIQRRYSEHTSALSDRHYPLPADIKAQETLRKAQWQTSLGFGSIPEVPQSRRHSLADVPTRHGSISSSGTQDRGSNPLPESFTGRDGTYPGFPETDPLDAEPAYFNATQRSRDLADARVQPTQTISSPYGGNLYHNPYASPSSPPLYIVNFKCCRSDVFYIQEGTGLHVAVGDLVIVEADRGTDLGTVQHVQVSWDEARRYKDYYAEEHYKWLMMFSQQSRNGNANVVNPNGPQGKIGSAAGGMGPSGHHGPHDAGHPDLKPKMIKRLAQNHEVQALKDKEGNEARAKRVCQQKVHEHRLNMEILDAEFQMDSKKLTFFYFADSYINFNSLVTDLFKIYKTRIWMSAINPASFQTPVASLGLVPAFPSAPVAGPEAHRRHFSPQKASAIPYEVAFDAERGFGEMNHPLRNAYYGQFHSLGSAAPQAGYMPSVSTHLEPFSQYYPQPYQMLNPNAASFSSNGQGFRNTSPSRSDENWMGRFHGLSLGQ